MWDQKTQTNKQINYLETCLIVINGKVISLRWCGTPCNIYKDDRILKNDYNHRFKNFKIYNICPQNTFIKFHKRDKK